MNGCGKCKLSLRSAALMELLDQHFSVRSELLVKATSIDAKLARGALLTADLLVIDQDSASTSIFPADACSFPRPYLDLLEFGAGYGPLFYEKLIAKGGAHYLNSVYRSGELQATEQILHFGRPLPFQNYKRRLTHLVWPYRPNLVKNEQRYETSLGEYAVRALFRYFLPREQALQAAFGWNGDLLGLYEAEASRWELAWTSKWDTAADARQFSEALLAVFNLRFLLSLDPGVSAVEFEYGSFSAGLRREGETVNLRVGEHATR